MSVYQSCSCRRALARLTMAFRCASLDCPHAVISSRLRKQPRQMSLSSRQQLRTQGDGTVVMGCRGGNRRSGIQVDAATGTGGFTVAIVRLTPATDTAPVMLAACIQQHRGLLFSTLDTLAALTPTPVCNRLLPGTPVVTNVDRVNRRVGRYGVDPACLGPLARFSLEALNAGVLGYKI